MSNDTRTELEKECSQVILKKNKPNLVMYCFILAYIAATFKEIGNKVLEYNVLYLKFDKSKAFSLALLPLSQTFNEILIIY